MWSPCCCSVATPAGATSGAAVLSCSCSPGRLWLWSLPRWLRVRSRSASGVVLSPGLNPARSLEGVMVCRLLPFAGTAGWGSAGTAGGLVRLSPTASSHPAGSATRSGSVLHAFRCNPRSSGRIEVACAQERWSWPLFAGVGSAAWMAAGTAAGRAGPGRSCPVSRLRPRIKRHSVRIRPQPGSDPEHL